MNTRLSKQERKAAQRQWRLHQKERKRIETEVAKRERQPGGITDADLKGLGLVPEAELEALKLLIPMSPAVQFVRAGCMGGCLPIFLTAN
jgi:hypothetical protein